MMNDGERGKEREERTEYRESGEWTGMGIKAATAGSDVPSVPFLYCTRLGNNPGLRDSCVRPFGVLITFHTKVQIHAYLIYR